MKAAVLGHPISHSLSPTLHNAAYAALGLSDWTYEAIDTEPDALPERLRTLRGPKGMPASASAWAGYSVTMPLKQAIVPLLDALTPTARALGVVNTVTIDGNDRLIGSNTDVDGIEAALYESGVTAVETAVILGSGATAASAAVALAEMGCKTPLVLARTLEEAEQFAVVAKALELAPKYAVADPDGAARVMARVDVVIGTAPAGAADPIAESLIASGAEPRGVLLDVIYDPRPTAISAAWSAAGGTVVGGERMLLHQAVKQVRLMTGRRAPVEAMDAALQAALN